MRADRCWTNASLAAAFCEGVTLSSRSYVMLSVASVNDFSSILGDEEGTTDD